MRKALMVILVVFLTATVAYAAGPFVAGGSGSGTSLPSQTGNDGKYLKTDGTTATWEAVASSALSGGTQYYLAVWNGADSLTKPAALGSAGNPLVSGGAGALPAWLAVVLAGGTNTFSITNGTASLDIAAGATLNIDTSLQTTTGAIVLAGQAGGSSVTLPATGTLLAGNGDGSALTGLQFDQFITQTAWRMFYSNADGDVTELAFGDSGKVLQSNGAAAAPTWETAGAGNVSKVGTPSDHQWGQWTGDGTLAGVTITASKPVCSDSDGAPAVCAGTEYTAIDLTAKSVTTIAAAATGGYVRLKEGSDNGTDYSSITGAADAGSNPSFTFGGSAAGAEDATFTATSNLWTWASSTSATFAFTPKVQFSHDAGLQVGSTGVLITSDNDGAITFTGASGGYDEDLTINLDDTENTAVVSSSTGVTKMDFSALNLVTTGYIQGGINISSDADGMDAAAMTAAGMYGTLFIATGAGTWILPRAALGMSICLMDSGTAHDLILDVTAGSTIRLKGTEGSDGVGITNASGSTTGDFVCVVAVATDKWSTMGMQGTWASQ